MDETGSLADFRPHRSGSGNLTSSTDAVTHISGFIRQLNIDKLNRLKNSISKDNFVLSLFETPG